MHKQAFADDFADGQAWREGAVGILEDDLHVRLEFLQFFAADAAEVMCFKADITPVRQHVQEGFAEGAFARTGFADDADGLPPVQVEIDAFHRVEGFARFAEEAAFGDEFDVHVFGGEQERCICRDRRFHAFRLGIDEFDGVVVLWRGEDLPDAALFDDFPKTHHADFFGIVVGEAEVVGDEDDGHAHLPLQVVQEVKDFRLDGDIQRSGRLVGDKQVGAVDERHGNHDALQLSAGKFVRVLFEAAFGFTDADAFKQAFATVVVVGGGGLGVVGVDRFAELCADAHVGVERGHRFLKDEADTITAQLAQFFFVRVQDGDAVEFDARIFAVLSDVWRVKAGDAHCGHRFAGAGFADQRQGLAFVELEADTAHGVDGVIMQAEVDVEVLHVQEWGRVVIHGHYRSFGSRASRRPSPIKLKQKSMMARMAAGK